MLNLSGAIMAFSGSTVMVIIGNMEFAFYMLGVAILCRLITIK